MRAATYPGGHAPRRADAIAPDFVAEIISPRDTASMIQERVRDWLDLDMVVRLIWLIYLDTIEAAVIRADGSSQIVPQPGALDGKDVFLGLRLPISSFVP